MSVVTKTGDRGQKGLADGSRVSKSHLQIEAYGGVDELNSWIGVIRATLASDHEIETTLAPMFQRIQEGCFVMGAHLALPSSAHESTRKQMPSLSTLDLSQLEKEISRFEKESQALKHFVLPGGHSIAAQLHVARTVARRCERSVARLLESEKNESWMLCLQFLNRLSDWFFTCARWVNDQTKTPETIWRGK